MSQASHHIISAHWECHERGIVCLNRDWRKESLPPLFMNPGHQPLGNLARVPPTEYGKRAGYFVNEAGELVFLLCPQVFPNISLHDCRFYVGGSFNEWGEAIGKALWELHLERLDGKDCYLCNVGKGLISKRKGHSFKFVTDRGEWLEIPADVPNGVLDEGGTRNFQLLLNRSGYHSFYFFPIERHLTLGAEELLWDSGSGSAKAFPIAFGQLLERMETDKQLGAFIADENTVFRLFAPRAQSVTVLLYEVEGEEPTMTLELARIDDTVWEKIYPKNLEGWLYHYTVAGENRDSSSHFDPSMKLLDPYALAAVSRQGPAVIVDGRKLAAPVSYFETPAWHDLVILETHVRDLLGHAPYAISDEDRLGFRGLAQWLRSGESYLTELGINAVELQPIQEFDNQSREEYHWGYMTCNYFSPESTYGSAPERASQIAEFQDLVAAFHEQEIAVILDVVYNHVGEPNHLLFIDKQYYFEVDADGELSNWSGCGNDLKCHAPMAKRLIIDSLIHLIEVYNVDGFRFDLAELIGRDVLIEIEVALKEVKPSVILIAEPWSFRGHIAHAMRDTGWASWNDGYREFLQDYVKAEANVEGMQYFLAGSPNHFARFPAQTVNYTESHDDRCWLDRITEREDFQGEVPSQNDRRRTHLMCSLLMMSIGIPMLAEGQDMLRSKQGINNTYQRGDVNALNYGRRHDYPGTYEYFRRWIQFRLSPLGKLLRLEHRPPEGYIRFLAGTEGFSAIAALFNAEHYLGNEQLFYAVNPHHEPVTIGLEGIALSEFKQIADHERFAAEGLDGAHFPIQEGKLILPGLSCCLWSRM